MKRTVLCSLVLSSCLLFAGQAQTVARSGAAPDQVDVASAPIAPSPRTFTLFSIPGGPFSGAYHITAAAGGNFWFTEQAANKVVKVTSDGVFSELIIPSPLSNPAGITACPNGKIYFAEQSTDKIGIIGRDETISELPLAGSNRRPFGLACQFDPTHTYFHVYVTQVNNNSVADIQFSSDGSSTLTENPIPTSNAAPGDITIGPDGALWFVESGASKIGKLDPITGNIVEFSPPTPSIPIGITSGGDTGIWFTEAYFANQVGNFLNGTFREYSIPTPNSLPFGLTWSPDGFMDLTEQMGDNILTFDPSNPLVAVETAVAPRSVETPLPKGSGASGIVAQATSVQGEAPVGLIAFLGADANYAAVAQTAVQGVLFTKSCFPNPILFGEILNCDFTVTNNTTVDSSFYITDDSDPLDLNFFEGQPGWTIWGDDEPVSDVFLVRSGETRTIRAQFVVISRGLIENRGSLWGVLNRFIFARSTVRAE